jgi:monoamine oxidase
VLAAPVDDRLFFAGEATSPNFFSTVHGAYETGLRAAAEVLKTLGR